MFKKVVLILFVLGIIGCGYRIVGLDTKVDYRFFIERVVSLDKESDYYSQLDNEVKSFFNNYNAISNDENHYDFRFGITLRSVLTDSAIITKASQTVQTDLSSKFNIVVFDPNGKKVFEKDYFSVQSYNITSNISQNIESRNAAFRKTVKNVLLDFLYDFQKVQK